MTLNRRALMGGADVADGEAIRRTPWALPEGAQAPRSDLCLSQDAMLVVHSSRANTTRRASDAAMLTAPTCPAGLRYCLLGDPVLSTVQGWSRKQIKLREQLVGSLFTD